MLRLFSAFAVLGVCSQAQLCRQTSWIAGTGSAGTADGIGTSALFNNPYELVPSVSPPGHLFIIEQQGNRIRFLNTSSGAVSSVAGSPTNTQGETDGVGSNALFAQPNGADIDPTCGTRGCLYISTYLGMRLRRVDVATAAVTTVAGNGDTSNVDGIGTSASVTAARGLALDVANQLLYFTTYSGYCQLRVVYLTSGLVKTLIGGRGCTSADGTGTVAAFNLPSGIRFAATTGLLYVAEAGPPNLRLVSLASPGVLNSTSTILTPNVPSSLRNLALDGNGNVYLPTYALSQSAVYVSRLVPSGPPQPFTLVAGNLTSPVASSDGVGTAASFNGLVSAAYIPATSTLYLTEQVVHKIRAVRLVACTVSPSASPSAAATPSPSPTACVPGAVTLIAGVTTPGVADGVGTNAKFTNPSGIAVFGDKVYIPSFTVNRISVASISSGLVTTLAGGGSVAGSTAGYVNAVGTAALFNNAPGVCLVSTGTTLYVADWKNYVVRVVNTATGAVTTLAGGGSAGGTLAGTANGIGTAATFGALFGCAVTSDDAVVYVADQGNSMIRAITVATLAVTTIAGSAAGYTNGIGTNAKFSGPQGVVFDFVTKSRIFVADQGNHLVRVINTTTLAVTTLAGGAGTTTLGHADGIGTSATMGAAPWVALDPSGANMYVADYSNNLVRKIVIASGVVTTVAGGGGGGGIASGNALGIGTAALFNVPYGVAVDATGNVIIADQHNHLLKLMASCVSTSASPSAAPTPSTSVSAAATASATRTGSPTVSPVSTPSSSPLTGQSPRSCPNGQLPINRTFSFPGTTWPHQTAGCFSFMFTAPTPDPAGLLYYFQVRTNGCGGYTAYLPLVNSRVGATTWGTQINLPTSPVIASPGTPNLAAFVVNATATALYINGQLQHVFFMRQLGYNISQLNVAGGNAPTSDTTVCPPAFSPSASATATASATPASTASTSAGVSASGTAVATVSTSWSPTASLTSTAAATMTSTSSVAPTASSTATGSSSDTRTASVAPSAPATQSNAATPSSASTPSSTSSNTDTPVSSPSLSVGASASSTPAPTATLSTGASASVTASAAAVSASVPPSIAGTATATASSSASALVDGTLAAAAAAGSGVAAIAGGAGAAVLLAVAVAAVILVRRRSSRAPLSGGRSSGSGGIGSGGSGGGQNSGGKGAAAALSIAGQNPLHAPSDRRLGQSHDGRVVSSRSLDSGAVSGPPGVAATAGSVWTEHWSNSRQQPYWRHLDGTTTWERPGAVAAPAAASALNAAFAKSSNRNLTALNVGGGPAVPIVVAGVTLDAQATKAGEENAKVGLPDGWSAHWSNSRAAWYWRNEAAGETRWSKPAASKLAGASQAGEEEASAGLPENWTAVWSKSRAAWYWRHTSGETAWEKPTE